MFKSRAKQVFEHLAERARWFGFNGHHTMSLESYLRRGEPLPDYLKPGAWIMSLPEKDREALKNLKSDDVQWYGYRL
jgi:hypothetical protein